MDAAGGADDEPERQKRPDAILTDQSKTERLASMARPKEFDRAAALERAMSVFWSKGYAATSTDDLLQAMKIGRQSMYDTFGDKKHLYVEALERYQRESIAGHIERLRSRASPMAGVEALLVGLISADERQRKMGCMGVNAVSEFGCTDGELIELRNRSSRAIHRALLERLQAAKTAGEIGSAVEIEDAARFVETTMLGLQVAARAGESTQALCKAASFAVARLKNG